MSTDRMNGSAALAESVKIQLGNVRRDWRVESSEHRARVSESLLEVERVCASARARIAEVQNGNPGQDGLDGAPGKDGAPGRDGVDGQHGVDGNNGMPGRDGIDGAPGRDGVDGTPGRDGVDGINGAPGRDGVNGIDGAPGRDGTAGLPGQRGERGERGEQGQPGETGAPGERGERGDAGPPGMFTTPTPFKAGQITYEGGLVYHEGSTFQALRDTAATPPHVDFQPVAFRGRDGKDAYCGRALGLYDESRTDYRALDLVTFNGSEWRAARDNPGPLPGDDWVLGAKGIKGKPGEKGATGERGAPGIGLKDVELVDTTLVFTRTDGSLLSVELAALVG